MLTKCFILPLFLLPGLLLSQTPSQNGSAFITERFDQCHKVSFIYKEGNFGGNIFIPLVEGDVLGFSKITQQSILYPSFGRSHGRLAFDPSKALSKGYSSWRYTYGLNNFGQFKGINMLGASKLVFWLRGKGTIEMIVGGTNRPPYKDPNPGWFEDGLDARSTGCISLNDNGWTRYELNLLDSTFWVYKGACQGANNKYSKILYYLWSGSQEAYMAFFPDGQDETGHGCFRINWTKPSNIFAGAGIAFFPPGGVWDSIVNGYNLKGITSVRFKIKMTKPGNVKVILGKGNPGGDSCGEHPKIVTVSTTGWEWVTLNLPAPPPTNPNYYSNVENGFGFIVDKQIGTPDSISIFLDSIQYIGTYLKTDLSQLITGADIVFSNTYNPDTAWVAFDSIYIDRPRLDEPRLPQSFVLPRLGNIQEDTLFQTQQMTAHIYDASLACIERLVRWYETGDPAYLRYARHIGDFFVFAQNHDREFTDGRLRNVYASGRYIDYDGFVRLPGYWKEDSLHWISDTYDYGTATGNMAWAGIALISIFEATGDSVYLASAERIAQWVKNNTWDDRGFNAGYEVVNQNDAWAMQKLQYTATEHCIDLFAFFSRLFIITGNENYHACAQHADDFVKNEMWDDIKGVFYTGTYVDGTGINTAVIPTDIQPWQILASNPDTVLASTYNRGYFFAKEHCYSADFVSPNFGAPVPGYDFSYIAATGILDGPWPEGTAQMACAACPLGDLSHRDTLLATLRYIQTHGPRNDGKGIPSAVYNGLTTGFSWQYHYLLHTGATAWFVFSEEKTNAYHNPKHHFECPLISDVHEPQRPGNLFVFPNPSAGPLTVALDLQRPVVSATLYIVDAQGRIERLLSSNIDLPQGEHHFNFDVHELPAGLYGCVFQSGEGMVVRKFVVIK